jgi:hypothetical protein
VKDEKIFEMYEKTSAMLGSGMEEREKRIMEMEELKNNNNFKF